MQRAPKFIIDDDQPTALPTCPRCGTAFSQRSMRIFENRADCFNCHSSFGLSELETPTQPGLGLPVVPQRVAVSEHESGWTIVVSLRTWNAMLVWAIALCLTAAIILLPKDWFALLLALCVPGMYIEALMRTFGHYAIRLQTPGTLVIFTGIGPIGRKKEIDWPALRSITLKTRKSGRSSLRKTIVLTADRVVEFGQLMNDDQRTWVAAFLLKHSST